MIDQQNRSDERPRKNNVGNVERLASAMAGAALLAGAGVPRDIRSFIKSGVAGALILRGISGRCGIYNALGFSSASESVGTHVFCKIAVERSPRDVYRYWRSLTNLPKFLTYVESVRVIDARNSKWSVNTLAGKLHYHAEIVDDRENSYLAWTTKRESEVQLSGSVSFKPVRSDATEVTVHIRFSPPSTSFLNKTVLSLGASAASEILKNDLTRLKQILETGEIATTKGQPRGEALSRIKAKYVYNEVRV